MTTQLLKSNRNYLIITIIALFIFAGGYSTLQFAPHTAQNKIANGLLADFVVTFPLLYYLVIIRPTKAPAKRILLIISLCLTLSYFLLPEHQREYILQLRKFTALGELLFIIYAISNFNKLRRAYKMQRQAGPDPIYNLRKAMAEVLGESTAVKLVSAELAVLRYGLFFWLKETSGFKNSRHFSTYKDYGYVALWCILMVAVLAEAGAFHLLLLKWSRTAAIIASSLTLYSMVLFIADLTAMIKRGVQIHEGQLLLRTGLRWRTFTALSNIESVMKISNDYNSDTPYFKGGIIKNSGNLVITFYQPVTIEKLYGAPQQVNTILMNIDNLDSFAEAVKIQPTS